ncbi:hypothetical protein B0T26DRAFT_39682 [Lasiosphaeria miniovina]|uniref:Uncharacterized protein n=1 Tax=Lasiosphaeria miniovina TaxID=1954250 RepID=A0AA40BGL0_9PEZI|nr:uncharacterized protein B0T26DRAFT_39682 [Lasiosphaeria miniovina]KAK0733855.1 hypothetical protein B0T26DRAFT_39682 [Lasiosphaeria miniovina]
MLNSAFPKGLSLPCRDSTTFSPVWQGRLTLIVLFAPPIAADACGLGASRCARSVAVGIGRHFYVQARLVSLSGLDLPAVARDGSLSAIMLRKARAHALAARLADGGRAVFHVPYQHKAGSGPPLWAAQRKAGTPNMWY